MPGSKLWITASAAITKNSFIQNGKEIFSSDDVPAAQLLSSFYRHRNIVYPRFFKMDLLSKAGFLGAELLLEGSNLAERFSPGEISVVLANASGSLDADYKYHDTIPAIPSPALFVYTLPNIVIGEICIRHQIKGETIFFISEKYRPQLMLDYMSTLFHSGRAKACIFGWVEAFRDNCQVHLWLAETGECKGRQLSLENITFI